MLCDICNKNTATVHLTEIIDEQMTELHLCEECARAKSMEMEQQFGLSDLLAGLADLGKTLEEKEIARIECDNCGFTYEDFRKIGRLGCSQCYNYFKKYLGPFLKRIHGSSQHVGKMPIKLPKIEGGKLELQELRYKLQQLIQREEFEEAAIVRDKIREVERSQNKENENR